MNLIRLIIIGLFFGLFSCQSTNTIISENLSITHLDGLNRTVTVPKKPLKILGLSPAMTEILFSIVPENNIVGVTHTCNYPLEAVSRKKRINTYPLDIEAIIAINPDIIFSEEGITSLADIAQIEKTGIPIYIFKYRKTRDILNAMDSIFSWCPSKENAKSLLDSLHQNLENLENISGKIKIENRPSMLAITWIDPIFAYGADTWMSDKMWLAGGKNSLQEVLDKPYPTLQREAVLKLNPDIVFGGSFEKLDSTLFRIYPELKNINAYKNKKIFELNDDFASRPGPRFLEGINDLKNKK
jgi:iron complex transport system substrate-binding protein